MPESERSRPLPEGGPDNHTDDAILTQGCDTAREIRARRRWESYWRRAMPASGYGIALATAEVDNIDRRLPGPLSISFQEARAFVASRHGLTCSCHGKRAS
jgi:hypothetical protein